MFLGALTFIMRGESENPEMAESSASYAESPEGRQDSSSPPSSILDDSAGYTYDEAPPESDEPSYTEIHTYEGILPTWTDAPANEVVPNKHTDKKN